MMTPVLRVIILGPPGAGKGTVAQALAPHLNIPHLSTGAMLRQAVASGSALGQQAQDGMATGQLLPDDLISRLVAQRLKEADCRYGYILDGFPRTIPQAQALHRYSPVDQVLCIEAAPEALLERINTRRTQESRPDDHPDTVPARLQVYEKTTKHLVDWYQSGRLGSPPPTFTLICGQRPIPDVIQNAHKALLSPAVAKLAHQLRTAY